MADLLLVFGIFFVATLVIMCIVLITAVIEGRF